MFSPSCKACELILPDWISIIDSVDSHSFRKYGLNLGGMEEGNQFLTSHGLNLEMLSDLETSTKEEYKLFFTPLTIVINENGVVEKVWLGAFNSETRKDVERYFGISLVDMPNLNGQETSVNISPERLLDSVNSINQ